FNDDIQGTAAIALAGVCGASRISGVPMEQQRIVMLGAGAAGIGIARLLRAELEHLGLHGDALARAIAVLDSHGLLHDARELDEAYKRELAWPARLVREAGLDPSRPLALAEVVSALAPTVLIGTSGTPGAFDEASVRAMAGKVARPAIFPFSNPNSKCEAHPADLIRWTDGRALIASGSPFDPVEHGGRTFTIAQGNNVYVFPGVGLGALAAEARMVTDGMFAAAAHAVADRLTDQDIAGARLYPSPGELRSISRAVARSVALRAIADGVAPRKSAAELDAALDALVWEPRYPRIRLEP
ncbi:MAG: oxaloacetate-decarboxylating malate dehydrogenase, partial [Sandaracinaceae bacterium]|nr:oxaloacetate-decarboxylating malate dehydrogenase [Sandaracinaceae bacterium]